MLLVVGGLYNMEIKFHHLFNPSSSSYIYIYDTITLILYIYIHSTWLQVPTIPNPQSPSFLPEKKKI